MYRTHALSAALALGSITYLGACTARAPTIDEDASGVDTGVRADSGGAGDVGNVDGGAHTDAGAHDGGASTSDTGRDGAASTVDGGVGACAPSSLGSMLGASVAHGSSAAAPDSGDRSCSGDPGAPDVQFSWTAPSAGTFVFDTGGSDYDTVLEVLTACGGTSLDCNDDRSADSQSRTQVTLTSGQRVVIVLDGFSTGGNYVLNIQADTAEVCDNTLDDDRDGYVDCLDPDCDTFAACHEANCTNGLDDDHDGTIDCADSDCATNAVCDESMHCTDHIDNDRDGVTDCDDSNCTSNAACAPETNCTNGVDDDNDGHVDCGDTDCSTHCGETMCADTVDNDMDGTIDCADRECACDVACTPAQVVSCPDGNLASMVGTGVYHGTFTGYSCGARADASCGLGGRGAEIELTWTAPAAGDYVFDTEDTARAGGLFDTVLSVRASCTGAELGCNDDGGTGYLSTLTLTGLTAGQTVVIVIDSYGVWDGGSYTLNIRAL